MFASWTLAKEYDVVDKDGTRPDWGAHFEKTYGPIPAADYASWWYGPMEAVAKKASADGIRFLKELKLGPGSSDMKTGDRVLAEQFQVNQKKTSFINWELQ